MTTNLCESTTLGKISNYEAKAIPKPKGKINAHNAEFFAYAKMRYARDERGFE